MLRGNHNPVNQILDADAENVFLKVIENNKFDIIHFEHLMGLPFSLVSLAKGKRIKTVFSLHDFYTLCPLTHLYRSEENYVCSGPEGIKKCVECLTNNLRPENDKVFGKFISLRQLMADKVLDSADLLLAPSEFVAEKFKTMGLKKEIKIIPLGIRSLDRLKRTGQNNITFGFVGTINKLKNVEMLIEAFSLTDDDISLKIYGSGEYEFIEKIKALTKKDRRISYYGEYKTADLPKIFSELDIAVVPSFIESYSLVVREAFSAGVPVIASNVGGIPEIVENGVNGLLFNPYNKVELLSLIKKVSKDTGLLHNLRKGIKPVKSINQEASELISEYKLLTNDNNIEVSILIPVFNKLEFTRICIDSVYENTPNTESYEIIVVDNASSRRNKCLFK